MKQTDVLIIGAGPGGYVAAIRLGQSGKKVLLVDQDKLGGECLNYGCIPSKALISLAGLVHKIQKAQEIGITIQNIGVDMAKIQQWKATILQGMNRGVLTLTKGNGVEFIQGQACFTGPKSAEVKTAQGGEKIEFRHALVATGSKPISIPDFSFDSKNILSSKEALDLNSIPKRLFVIGGGVIGLEIGTFYAKLGSQVTIVEMMPQLLPGVEQDLVQPVARSLQKLGITVHLNSQALRYSLKDGALSVSIRTPEGEKHIASDKILASVGRAPNTGTLNLEAAGIVTTPKGFVDVDAAYKTSADGIYAIGDVIGPPFLAHKASREGLFIAAVILGEEPEPLGFVPWAVFTDPEVAFVGLTEAQALEQGYETQIGRFPFAASGRAVTTRESDGFVKIVSQKGSGRILGVGIVGTEASDLISEACLAIRLKATVHDVASTIHPHPTLPEAFLEASEAAAGQPIHILTKKS
ncbi:MAG: dihydrolipoyl dehydrogenase [Elusimicrobia bacterium]|nr:dihydrolipoyl dehydrogenase [Elusimicrobiota bacterium]